MFQLQQIKVYYVKLLTGCVYTLYDIRHYYENGRARNRFCLYLLERKKKTATKGLKLITTFYTKLFFMWRDFQLCRHNVELQSVFILYKNRRMSFVLSWHIIPLYKWENMKIYYYDFRNALLQVYHLKID